MMKLTIDPKRIKEAYYILQRLEDEVVGYMTPTNASTKEECECIYKSRLNEIHNKVWEAIKQLNEAFDGSSVKQ